MRVFISWSGKISHEVALALHDWLPSVLQAIDPYVSSEDIDKGARWGVDLARELESSDYGIICLTADNLKAPWLNFEAGALSKSFTQSRVSPFLFEIKNSELPAPLAQFQTTTVTSQDMLKLVRGINSACGEAALEESRIPKIFAVWWPQLEKKFDEIRKMKPESPDESPNRAPIEILEEILSSVRAQQRLLSSPEQLIPQTYISDALNEMLPLLQGRVSSTIAIDLDRRLLRTVEALDKLKKAMDVAAETEDGGGIGVIEALELLERAIFQLAKPIGYLKRNA